jgi:hypothetical protein
MIYLYCLKQNNKIKYIGLTKNPRKREMDHKNQKPSPHKFIILENFKNIQVAAKREFDLISEYSTINNGWNISPGGEYYKNSGYKRTGIGGQKKGCIPWNKGVKNCFSKDTINRMKNVRKGVIHSSKVTADVVLEIRKKFKNHPTINNVGNVMKNGRILTQHRAFSELYYKDYNITAVNLYNIIKRKSWTQIN